MIGFNLNLKVVDGDDIVDDADHGPFDDDNLI
jgi:hypothetical protein